MLRVEIFEYWRCGTGRGDGPVADQTVVRTREGLPYLPGKTIKGLLREAVQTTEDVKKLPEETTNRLFGSALPPDKSQDDSLAAVQEKTRFDTRPGQVAVQSAELGKSQTERLAWAHWAADGKNAPLLQQLYRTLSSTALEGGVAKDGSLRSAEVVVPLDLWAWIDIEEAEDRAALVKALPMFRDLGGVRTRGFGRCRVTLAEAKI